MWELFLCIKMRKGASTAKASKSAQSARELSNESKAVITTNEMPIKKDSSPIVAALESVFGGVTDEQIDAALDDNKDLDPYESMRDIYLHESIIRLYKDSACPGDELMTLKAQHIGRKNKDAINNRARYHKKQLLPYVKEELESNENREWWTHDIYSI